MEVSSGPDSGGDVTKFVFYKAYVTQICILLHNACNGITRRHSLTQPEPLHISELARKRGMLRQWRGAGGQLQPLLSGLGTQEPLARKRDM